jgi:hypothetical protein
MGPSTDASCSAYKPCPRTCCHPPPYPEDEPRGPGLGPIRPPQEARVGPRRPLRPAPLQRLPPRFFAAEAANRGCDPTFHLGWEGPSCRFRCPQSPASTSQLWAEVASSQALANFSKEGVPTRVSLHPHPPTATRREEY